MIPPLGTVITADLEIDPNTPRFNTIGIEADGSRRIVQRTAGLSYGSAWAISKERYLMRDHPTLIWGEYSAAVSGADLQIGYLPYPPADGIAVPAVPDPVNQIPYLLEWRAHVARFMHGYDLFHNARSVQSLPSDVRQVLEQQALSMAGTAWSELALWAAQVDSNGKPLDHWVAAKALPERVIAAICDCANIFSWPREMGQNFNAGEFRMKLFAGQVYGVDKSTTPWSPGQLLTSLSSTAPMETTDKPPAPPTSVVTFLTRLAAQAEYALDHYDRYVAHEEVPHGHAE